MEIIDSSEDASDPSLVLPTYGYSKDKRNDLKQIVMGMATILWALLPESAGEFFLGLMQDHIYISMRHCVLSKWVRLKDEMDAFRDAVSFCLHRCQYGRCKRR